MRHINPENGGRDTESRCGSKVKAKPSAKNKLLLHPLKTLHLFMTQEIQFHFDLNI